MGSLNLTFETKKSFINPEAETLKRKKKIRSPIDRTELTTKHQRNSVGGWQQR